MLTLAANRTEELIRPDVRMAVKSRALSQPVYLQPLESPPEINLDFGVAAGLIAAGVAGTLVGVMGVGAAFFLCLGV